MSKYRWHEKVNWLILNEYIYLYTELEARIASSMIAVKKKLPTCQSECRFVIIILIHSHDGKQNSYPVMNVIPVFNQNQNCKFWWLSPSLPCFRLDWPWTWTVIEKAGYSLNTYSKREDLSSRSWGVRDKWKWKSYQIMLRFALCCWARRRLLDETIFGNFLAKRGEKVTTWQWEDANRFQFKEKQ